MHRFFCPTLPPAPTPGDAPEGSAGRADSPADLGVVELPEDEAHHAARVLRLEPGEAVELFDGAGRVARGVMERRSVRVTGVRDVPPATLSLHVAVAIPKGPRADDMVNQLSQLGVDRLIPLRAERGVTDPREHKLEKFQRHAIESAKQSGRAWLMKVTPTTDFDEALRLDAALRLFADPAAAPMNTEELGRALRGVSSVLVLIGPEGGWTDGERARARAAGCVPWNLGPHVLRIETAAVAAAAIIRHLAP